jgi:hypothetical protein
MKAFAPDETDSIGADKALDFALLAAALQS